MDSADNNAFSTCVYKKTRVKQADAFTRYIDSRDSKKAYVVNLNGAWGTGKTFFVDNWCRRLKEKEYVSVKIDVWESDYLNDPLAILTAELLEELKKSGVEDFSESERKIFHAAGKLAKNFLPVLLSVLGNQFLGSEYKDVLKDIGASAKDFINDSSSSGNRMGDFGEHIFAVHKKHKEFVLDFKNELTNLVSIICDKSKKDRVYIFIDELDRCRPTYAVEMLEVVKHLFDIPKLAFVMSTDTKQLECSIKSLYGEQFDSEEYLSRFFQRRLTLSEPKYLEFIKSIKAFIWMDFSDSLIYPPMDTESAQEVVALFCEYNKVPLRRVEQLCARIDAALINLPSDAVVFFIELVGSIFSYELYPNRNLKYYDLFMHGSHEKDGFKYRIKVIGDVSGINPNTVLSFHDESWKLILKLSSQISRDKKIKILSEIRESLELNVKRCYRDVYVGGLPYFLGHNRTATFDVIRMVDANLVKMIDNDLNVLSGQDLEDFLHIFDEIS